MRTESIRRIQRKISLLTFASLLCLPAILLHTVLLSTQLAAKHGDGIRLWPAIRGIAEPLHEWRQCE